MPTVTAIADGNNEVERNAASDAIAVQDAVNLVAIVGAWHRHLLAMHRAGICGDALINHPVNLAFVSKLNSLCRMTFEREMAALSAIDHIERGESVEYEVIPLFAQNDAEDEADTERCLNIEYRCPNCGHEWEEQWSCACDSECPACGTKDIAALRWDDAK